MSKFVHVQISEELLDLLAGYALNILTGEDLAAVEAHLAGGCELCEKQVAAFQATAVEAIRSGPVWLPPAHIRERLMKLTERTGEDHGSTPQVSQVWKTWQAEALSAEIQIVRSDHGEWQEVHAGIWVKRLHVDADRDTVTMLIRMEPGASYVPHRHGGPEQCYVIQGDLRDGDVVVGAGDFQCAPESTMHGAQTTEKGCLLLIVSSLRDELLT